MTSDLEIQHRTIGKSRTGDVPPRNGKDSKGFDGSVCRNHPVARSRVSQCRQCRGTRHAIKHSVAEARNACEVVEERETSAVVVGHVVLFH